MKNIAIALLGVGVAIACYGGYRVGYPTQEAAALWKSAQWIPGALIAGLGGASMLPWFTSRLIDEE